eukprot:scaffold1560_cov394-Pavlova_lutheri.AAC.1
MNPCASTSTRASTASGWRKAKCNAAAPPRLAPSRTIGLPCRCWVQKAWRCLVFASGPHPTGPIGWFASSSKAPKHGVGSVNPHPRRSTDQDSRLRSASLGRRRRNSMQLLSNP